MKFLVFVDDLEIDLELEYNTEITGVFIDDKQRVICPSCHHLTACLTETKSDGIFLLCEQNDCGFLGVGQYPIRQYSASQAEHEFPLDRSIIASQSGRPMAVCSLAYITMAIPMSVTYTADVDLEPTLDLFVQHGQAVNSYNIADLVGQQTVFDFCYLSAQGQIFCHPD